jgi:hypothetical protein
MHTDILCYSENLRINYYNYVYLGFRNEFI